MPQNYKKRRIIHGPSKNELRVARNEREDAARNRAGTLRQAFPNIISIQLDYSLKSPAGMPLDEGSRKLDLDEPLILEIACPSTCGNGKFSIADKLEAAVSSGQEVVEGEENCDAVSYMDPQAECGTALHYEFSIEYKGESK